MGRFRIFEESRRNVRAVFALFLLLAGAAASARGAEVRIAVVVSHRGEPFDETLKGFRKHIADRGMQVRIDVQRLEGNPARGAAILRDLRVDPPDLVFTLGLLAAESVSAGLPDVPIVAGMVPRADALGKSANRAAVQLDFPLETQLRWLRRVLPEAVEVGVLYNPAENARRIAAASRLARELGLSLETREVRSPRDLPAALESLKNRADVLWGLHDSMVYTPETARRILLFSFRHRIPVIGPSAQWVRAGALFALDRDYADLGGQCGEAAVEILRGRPPGELPAAGPRKTEYVINLTTARMLGIDLPELLVRGARQTFAGGE